MVIAVGSCTGSATEPPAITIPALEPRSGTRLRVQWARAVDGARVATGFRDTEWDVGCGAGLDEDGRARCMPRVGRAIYFADPDCTIPAVSVTAGAPEPTLLYIDTPVDRRATVYRVAGPVAEVFRRRVPDGCDPVATPAGVEHRRAGERLPPSSFVALDAVIEPIDARLALRSLVASDGTRIPDGLVDLSRAEGCEPLETLDGVLRCLPSWNEPSTTTQVFYLRDTCRGADAAVVGASLLAPQAPAPRYGLAREWVCTHSRYAVVEVGDEIAPPDMLYSADGAGQCFGGPPIQTFHAVTRTLAADTFPEISFADPTAGRLRPTRGELGILPLEFFDRELGLRCAPRTDRDGQLRCLPSGTFRVEELFTDAACSRAVRRGVMLRIAQCSATPPPAYAGGRDERVYRVGREDAAPLYDLDLDGACVSARSANGVYFELTEVAPSLFAPLVESED